MNIKTAAFYVKFAEYAQRIERKHGYFPQIIKEVVGDLKIFPPRVGLRWP
jgi:hypothetical protein